MLSIWAQLERNIAEYNRILSSKENETEIVIKELLEIKDRFGDNRRTEISNDAATIDDESLIPEEEIVITLSRGGYVKRLTTDTFRAQNRGRWDVSSITMQENTNS